MKIADYISKCIQEYPSLYKDVDYEKSKLKVLCQIFFTVGNGLEMADTENPKEGGYVVKPKYKKDKKTDDWIRIKDKPYVLPAVHSLPKLLDLYCCGGGAGYGYEQAGYDVTGVDIEPQPKHRGNFIQADAIEYLKAHFHEYDVIHASPPCQAYSMASMQFRKAGKEYVDLIEVTRMELIKTGKPYIIENVPGSPLINPIELCGSMFGMKTYRHRLFESNIELKEPPHPEHTAPNTKMGRKPKDGEFIQYVGHFSGVGLVREMTGLYWLGQGELAQSIPPQYTKYIGEQLMVALSLHCR